MAVIFYYAFNVEPSRPEKWLLVVMFLSACAIPFLDVKWREDWFYLLLGVIAAFCMAGTGKEGTKKTTGRV